MCDLLLSTFPELVAEHYCIPVQELNCPLKRQT